jgi:nucleoside-diphosphate-sugar epimerase
MPSQPQPAWLVTGAAGFIGRSVCARLSERGTPFVALDASSSGAGRVRFDVVGCDISDLTRLNETFKTHRIGGVIHLAAVLPTAARSDPALAGRVNLGGSFNLLEMASRHNIDRFVYASSLSVYGPVCGETSVNEEFPAAPRELYGAAKLYIEMLGKTLRQKCGLEFAALRIPVVVGSGAQSATSAWRSRIFEALGESSPPAPLLLPCSGAEALPLAHVDDVAAMLLTLAEARQLSHTVYNCPAESWTMSALSRELQRLHSHVRVELCSSERTIPGFVDSSRFASEFGCSSVPLTRRLADATAKRQGHAT